MRLKKKKIQNLVCADIYMYMYIKYRDISKFIGNIESNNTSKLQVSILYRVYIL